ncbi:bestrophin family protein [Bacterioplanoides pacificum]|uniref:Bestrophin family protein n=1 Tax=Bacterioplanoides pacificum TaxID=1171596 RepID=A0ABV7VUW9_9GAMM
MIVRDRPSALALLFIVRGSVVPRILPHLLVLALFATAVVVLHHQQWVVLPEFSLAPFALLGIALSIFLGFRNNAAYDRWWEGRKQWGEMVYKIRSLARSSETLLDLEAENGRAGELRRQLLHWAVAHCHALRAAVRNEQCEAALIEWLGETDAEQALTHKNVADYCLRRAGRVVGKLYRDGNIDAIGLRILDEHLTRLSGVQAASERIATTPLPFAYTLLTHRTAYLYCYLLPFALVTAMGGYAVLFTLVVAYTFFGLDVLSQEMEDPFGREANDLPLDALCRVNEISVAESLGRTPPEILMPKNHRLE